MIPIVAMNLTGKMLKKIVKRICRDFFLTLNFVFSFYKIVNKQLLKKFFNFFFVWQHLLAVAQVSNHYLYSSRKTNRYNISLQKSIYLDKFIFKLLEYFYNNFKYT